MSNNLLTKLFLLLFTTVSLGTSAVAGAKVVTQLQPEPARATSPVAIENITSSVSPTPAILPTPTPTVTPDPTSCLIILFGQNYNVTPLKSTHPGGDIFVCNTDMTATYQSVHGTNVSRMAPYLVSTPPSQPTPIPANPNPTPTPSPTPIYHSITNDDDSEHEDLEQAEQEDEEEEDEDEHEDENEVDHGSDHD